MGVKTRKIDSNRCAEEFSTITIRQTPLLLLEKAKTGKSKYRRFCTPAYNHWGSTSRKPQIGGEVNREETDPTRLVGWRFELGTTELVMPPPLLT